MLLSEVLDLPELELFPVVSPSGDRPVRSVYTTDLPDPVGYLESDQLVLTSATWYHHKDDAERFIGALSGSGCAALVLGVAGLGRVPQPVIDVSRHYRVPLFTIADNVSFGSVTTTVNAALASRTTGTSRADLHRGMLASLAAGEGPEGLVKILTRSTGMDCLSLSTTGHLLGGQRPDAEVTRLSRAFHNSLTDPVFPNVQSAGRGRRVSFYQVQSAISRRPPAAYVVTEGDYREYEPWVTDAITEVCALIAMSEAARQDRRLIEQRFSQESLKLVRAGDPAAAEARLSSLGLEVTAPITVVFATTQNTRYGTELAAVILGDITRSIPGTTEPIVSESGYLVLVPNLNGHAEQDVIDLCQETAERLRPLVSGGSIAVGTGTPAVGIAALRRSLEEARHSHRVASVQPGWFRGATSSNLSSHLLLLASVPAEVRHMFRQRLIGPIEDYDDEHNSNLVPTLEAFLDHSGSWSSCATSMHLHVNTLRYRIRRIEELTGRGLASLDDRVDFRLALSISAPDQQK